MQFRFVLCLVCAFVGAAIPARAQDRTPLSLRDALVEARRANPELVALQREYDSVRAATPEARFLEPPMFDAQIWGWPVTTLNPVRTDMYMFMGEQALPGKGKRAARERVASLDADVSYQQIAVRANSIFNEVKQAWAELLLARATADLYRQQTPILENTAEAATLRYASGHAGQHDTVKTVVELARLQADTIEWRERANAHHWFSAMVPSAISRSATAPASAACADTTSIRVDSRRRWVSSRSANSPRSEA